MMPVVEFVEGGEEMGELFRHKDWTQTPIGPAETWPQSLRSAISICLGSDFPTAVYWGPQLVLLYNDAWREILGPKHPEALGQPASAVWPEIWDSIGPLFDHLTLTGTATRSKNRPTSMRRHDHTEKCYFDHTFSPIRGECGRVEGIFSVAFEATERVINERRLALVGEFSASLADARTSDAVVTVAAETLSKYPADIPFALLYLLSTEQTAARLAATVNLKAGTLASPAQISLVEPSTSFPTWPLAEAFSAKAPVLAHEIQSRFGLLPGGPLTESPSAAIVLPIAHAGRDLPYGWLVAGISPRRALDSDYRGFFDLITGQIAQALANVDDYEQISHHRPNGGGDAEFPVVEGVAARVWSSAEKTRSETALRASEARFRAAVQANSSVMWTNNASGQMEGEQPAWGAFTGQHRDDYQGYGWSKAVHPSDAQPTIDAWEKAVAARGLFVFEHRVRRHDGTWRLCSVRAVPVLDHDGNIVEWVGVSNDITEERSLLASLQQSEARFRQLADAMPQMVWTARPDGHLDYYNERWYQFTGFDRETFGDITSWESIVHPADMAHLRDKWAASLETGDSCSVECRFLDRKASSYRWYLCQALSVRGGQANVMKWFGTCTDIDQQKETERELRRANLDLEQFAYSASHDLQEPLRSVSIYSELLDKRYRGKLDGQAIEFLEYLKSGASRMEMLVRDLLAYTQVSKLDAPPEEADANVVLETVLSNLAESIAQNHAQVIASPLPVLKIHRTHLHQLFQNLIGNALKYCSKEPPVVHLKAERQSGYWLISVCDNGIGIDPEYKERVFGLFKRLHTGDEYSGTGLGLAICQRIVERNHGRIWVESQLGKGSTFYFTVPA